MRLLGAVLAGGQSRRFGSDKAEALLNGSRLIDLAGEMLTRHCDDVIVVGRSDPSWISVPDVPKAGLGPLGGLCGALQHGDINGYEAVLVVPCDLPDLPDEIAAQLIARQPAACAAQPVVGCWPTSLNQRLEAFLDAEGRHSMRAWCETIGAVMLDSAPLPNVNSPEDLQSLQ